MGVDARRLRVRMVGLLPAILAPCGAACARPFLNEPVRDLSREAMDDTPSFVRQNGERAHAIAEQLFKEFGDSVRIEILGLDSPRGVLFAARHRLGKEFTVVVGRDRVLRDPESYGAVRSSVADALRERASGGR